jgi:dienelactone hydrolase
MVSCYRASAQSLNIINCFATPMALEDAQRTVGLVRLHAAEYHIDPRKIGVLGFSAGGHLVTDISTHFDKRSYPSIDAADKESCRPDFAVALYPGHLWISSYKKFELNPDVPVNRQTLLPFCCRPKMIPWIVSTTPWFTTLR